MREVSIKRATCQQLVGGVVEFLVGNILHHPSGEEYPHPGSGGVEALDRVVAVQWVEEEESSLRVVLWRTQGIQEDGEHDRHWSPCSLAQFIPLAHHLFEIQLVDDTLGEKNGVVVDHHEHMVKWLVWSLVFPVVKST